MRIYMAGIYAGRSMGSDVSAASHHIIIRYMDIPYILESYHYMDAPRMQMIKDNKTTIFLDSGAFSMFTQGVEIDLGAFARFIKEHNEIIHIASNLDAIGQGKEELTYRNQQKLEKMDVKIQPVFHVRDHDEWLQRYLDEGYDYIFIGGMVPESTPYLKTRLDYLWKNYLTKKDGTPRIKIHGFGLTSLPLMFRYPWYSVDSTSWVLTSRFGAIYLDLKRPDGSFKDIKVDFSLRSKKREQLNSWHFETLKQDEQKIILARLNELEEARPKDKVLEKRLEVWMKCKQGFNPDALGASYGWRDRANIEYFKRAMNRGTSRFIPEQETLFNEDSD